MTDFVENFPGFFIWLIGVLATGGLGLLIYFVKENISVLKKLNTTVNGILVRFAAHEENNINLRGDVEKLEGRVDRHDKDIEDLKIDVSGLKDKTSRYDKS
jgi:hypothetical protein